MTIMKKLFTWILSAVFVIAGISAAQAMSTELKDSKAMQSARTTAVKKKVDKSENIHKRGPGSNRLAIMKKPSKTTKKGSYAAKGSCRPNKHANAIIKKPAGEYPDLRGTVIAADNWVNDAAIGVYSIPFDEQQDFICDFRTQATWNGVLKDGIYYATEYVDFFGLPFIDIYGYDAESGEELFCFNAAGMDAVPMALTVDPTDGEIYGFFYNNDGSGYTFGTISYTSQNYERTVIREMDGDIWCALAVSSNGKYYAIERIVDEEYDTLDSKLYSLDKNTGNTTEIGSTGQLPKYISSAVIDPSTDRMFWNVCPLDATGLLCEVDLNTGTATPIYKFPNNEEIVGMYIAEPEAEPEAPAALESCQISFEDGSLTGHATIMAPSSLYNGTHVSEPVEIIVEAHNEIIAQKTADYGSQTVIPLTMENAGMYSFKAYARNSAGEGPKSVIRNVWVGTDTPEAPEVSAEYHDSKMHLTWTAVTGSINGGYINPSEITYNIRDNEGNEVADHISETYYTFTLEEPESITNLRYEVYAVFDNNVSSPGVSNNVVLGSITPPYIPEFDIDGLSGWTVIDTNEDGITWDVYRNYVRCKYNRAIPMDDWLITPPIKVEANKAYAVTFTAFNQRSDCTERIEVKYGNAPTVEGMDRTLLSPTELSGNKTPYTFTKFATSDADGKLYIGFHGISDTYQLYLNLSDISIEPGISALAPGEVSDLKAVPDAEGDFKATISFKAPELTINGQSLGSLTKIEVTRDGKLVKVFDTPAPGDRITFEDVATEGGDAQYIVTPYNSEGSGIPSSTVVFMGTNLPATLQNVRIASTSNTGEAVLSWDEITCDYLGNPIAPGLVKYNVYRYMDENLELISDNIEGTSYSFQAVESGKQEFVQCAVFGVTERGEGEGSYSAMIPLGTPYAGMQESGDLNYIIGFENPNTSRWKVYDSSTLELAGQDDDKYFGCVGFAEDTWGDLSTGLISLEGMVDPGLTFYTYNLRNEYGERDVNELVVSVREFGEEKYTELLSNTVDALCKGVPEKWSKISVDLSDYAEKVIQIKITAITKLYEYTLLDNIGAGSMLEHNLKALTISAPPKVACGKTFNVDVKVANFGSSTAASYSVNLLKDGQNVATKTCNALEEGANAVISFEQEMSPLATEPVSYYAVIDYGPDKDLSDNRTPVIDVTPKLSALPKANNLTAANDDNSVVLTWDKPILDEIPTQPVTYDFEDADPFSAEYGDWIFVDGDKVAVGGVLGRDIPNIIAGVTTGSFWAWDTTEEAVAGVSNTEAHSGTKFLFALFRWDDGPTDDWAVSPALCGKAQTISFYAKSLREDFPEKIEIYYSMGGTDPADFKLIENAGAEEVPEEWTLYEATIPAGATHFAIHSCASGSFMLMIDDVTFIPGNAASGSELLGYDIYRDGIKINNSTVGETGYVDSEVIDGEEYDYVVLAVYDTGYSQASNVAHILFERSGVEAPGENVLQISADDGCIIVKNAEGLEVSVWNTDGTLRFSGQGKPRLVIDADCGIYVVKAGGTVKKVMVR